MGPSRHNHRKSRSDAPESGYPENEIPLPLPASSSNASYLQNLILAIATFSFLRDLSNIRFFRSSPRPISIDKLTHHCVYTVNLSTLLSARGLTSLRCGILLLEGGFTLRCLQRLSRPYFASLLCRWHDNSCTRGTSIPVLSY